MNSVKQKSLNKKNKNITDREFKNTDEDNKLKSSGNKLSRDINHSSNLTIVIKSNINKTKNSKTKNQFLKNNSGTSSNRKDSKLLFKKINVKETKLIDRTHEFPVIGLNKTVSRKINNKNSNNDIVNKNNMMSNTNLTTAKSKWTKAFNDFNKDNRDNNTFCMNKNNNIRVNGNNNTNINENNEDNSKYAYNSNSRNLNSIEVESNSKKKNEISKLNSKSKLTEVKALNNINIYNTRSKSNSKGIKAKNKNKQVNQPKDAKRIKDNANTCGKSKNKNKSKTNAITPKNIKSTKIESKDTNDNDNNYNYNDINKPLKRKHSSNVYYLKDIVKDLQNKKESFNNNNFKSTLVNSNGLNQLLSYFNKRLDMNHVFFDQLDEDLEYYTEAQDSNSKSNEKASNKNLINNYNSSICCLNKKNKLISRKNNPSDTENKANTLVKNSFKSLRSKQVINNKTNSESNNNNSNSIDNNVSRSNNVYKKKKKSNISIVKTTLKESSKLSKHSRHNINTNSTVSFTNNDTNNNKIKRNNRNKSKNKEEDIRTSSTNFSQTSFIRKQLLIEKLKNQANEIAKSNNMKKKEEIEDLIKLIAEKYNSKFVNEEINNYYLINNSNTNNNLKSPTSNNECNNNSNNMFSPQNHSIKINLNLEKLIELLFNLKSLLNKKEESKPKELKDFNDNTAFITNPKSNTQRKENLLFSLLNKLQQTLTTKKEAIKELIININNNIHQITNQKNQHNINSLNTLLLQLQLNRFFSLSVEDKLKLVQNFLSTINILIVNYVNSSTNRLTKIIENLNKLNNNEELTKQEKTKIQIKILSLENEFILKQNKLKINNKLILDKTMLDTKMGINEFTILEKKKLKYKSVDEMCSFLSKDKIDFFFRNWSKNQILIKDSINGGFKRSTKRVIDRTIKEYINKNNSTARGNWKNREKGNYLLSSLNDSNVLNIRGNNSYCGGNNYNTLDVNNNLSHVKYNQRSADYNSNESYGGKMAHKNDKDFIRSKIFEFGDRNMSRYNSISIEKNKNINSNSNTQTNKLSSNNSKTDLILNNKEVTENVINYINNLNIESDKESTISIKPDILELNNNNSNIKNKIKNTQYNMDIPTTNRLSFIESNDNNPLFAKLNSKRNETYRSKFNPIDNNINSNNSINYNSITKRKALSIDITKDYSKFSSNPKSQSIDFTEQDNLENKRSIFSSRKINESKDFQNIQDPDKNTTKDINNKANNDTNIINNNTITKSYRRMSNANDLIHSHINSNNAIINKTKKTIFNVPSETTSLNNTELDISQNISNSSYLSNIKKIKKVRKIMNEQAIILNKEARNSTNNQLSNRQSRLSSAFQNQIKKKIMHKVLDLQKYNSELFEKPSPPLTKRNLFSNKNSSNNISFINDIDDTNKSIFKKISKKTLNNFNKSNVNLDVKSTSNNNTNSLDINHLKNKSSMNFFSSLNNSTTNILPKNSSIGLFKAKYLADSFKCFDLVNEIEEENNFVKTAKKNYVVKEEDVENSYLKSETSKEKAIKAKNIKDNLELYTNKILKDQLHFKVFDEKNKKSLPSKLKKILFKYLYNTDRLLNLHFYEPKVQDLLDNIRKEIRSVSKENNIFLNSISRKSYDEKNTLKNTTIMNSIDQTDDMIQQLSKNKIMRKFEKMIIDKSRKFMSSNKN